MTAEYKPLRTQDRWQGGVTVSIPGIGWQEEPSAEVIAANLARMEAEKAKQSQKSPSRDRNASKPSKGVAAK